jgi:hypothetical protein
MGRQKNTAAGQRDGAPGQGQAEGYPSLGAVFAAIKREPDLKDTGVRRMQITTLATGEATYQILYVDSEEAVTGYLEKV